MYFILYINKLNPCLGYNIHFCERGGDEKKGGGLCVIWKKDVNLVPWDFVVPKEKENVAKERQWYLLATRGTKYAIMNVYLAFETTTNRNWNDDLTSLMRFI